MNTSRRRRQSDHQEEAVEEDVVKTEECHICGRMLCKSLMKRHKKWDNCRPKEKILEVTVEVAKMISELENKKKAAFASQVMNEHKPTSPSEKITTTPENKTIVVMKTTTPSNTRKSKRVIKPKIVFTPSKSTENVQQRQQKKEQVELSTVSPMTLRAVRSYARYDESSSDDEDNEYDDSDENDIFGASSPSAATSSDEGQQQPAFHASMTFLPVVPEELRQEQQRLEELLKQVMENNQRTNCQWNPSFFLHMNRYKPEQEE